MAQTGYSPISLYYSTTASAAPTAGNLVSGELAVNITDGVLFYKDNAGVVQTLATKVATSGTYTALTITGGTANGVGYLNGSKQFTTGSALTFDGTGLSVTGTTSATLKLNGRSSDNASSANFYDNTGATRYGFIYFDASNAQIASANANPLAFLINSSEQMRLTSTGLGVGTTSITARLTVNGNSAFTGSLSATDSLTITTNSGSNNQQLKIVDTAVGGHNWSIGSGLGATGSLAFYDVTAGAIRATLDSSGNLGLGVTPSAWSGLGGKAFEVGLTGNYLAVGSANQLWLGTNSYYNGGWKYATTAAASQYYQYAGAHSWFTAASGTAGTAITFTQAMTLFSTGGLSVGTTSDGGTGVISAQNQFRIAANSYSRVADTDAGGGFGGGYNFAMGGTSTPKYDSTGLIAGYYYSTDGSIRWYTGGSAAAGTSAPERARIDSSGSLLVGTTSTTLGQTGIVMQPAIGGQVAYITLGHANGTSSGNGYLGFGYNGSLIGSITQNGTAGVLYNITSDHRLKDVVGAVTGSGERIDALKPVNYTWKADGSAARGFLAHEFQEVYANSVTGTKDAVDEEGNPIYQQMQASTTEVIADLVAEIQSLRKRLAALEGK